MPTIPVSRPVSRWELATNAVVVLPQLRRRRRRSDPVRPTRAPSFHSVSETWRIVGWDAQGIAGEASHGALTMCFSKC